MADRPSKKWQMSGTSRNSVPSGHNVVEVDDLDERLDASAAQHTTAGHRLGNGAGSLVDTNDNGVGEGTGLGGLLDGSDDDSLASGILTLGEKDDLTLLQELNHPVFLHNIKSQYDARESDRLHCNHFLKFQRELPISTSIRLITQY